MTSPPVALTIAGSDSGGGAGVQADLKAMTYSGVHGCTAVTALTAQNSVGVQDIVPMTADFVRNQIHSVCSDFNVRATKTGMLFNRDIIETVAGERDRLGFLVMDPVMLAQSGDPLLEESAEQSLIRTLLPRADLMTPNLPEARKIAGHLELPQEENYRELGGQLAAALDGPAVLIKAGHVKDDPESVDWLVYPDGEHRQYAAPRLHTEHTHGSGCALSSLIASQLARDELLPRAVEEAKKEVTRAIREGYKLGRGPGTLNFLGPWKNPGQ